MGYRVTIYLCLLWLTGTISGYSQTYTSTQIDADGVYLDLISFPDDHRLFLVTSTGLYGYNGERTALISEIGQSTLLPALQNFSRHNTQVYFPKSDGSIQVFGTKETSTVNLGQEGRVLPLPNGDTWLVNDSILIKAETDIKFKLYSNESVSFNHAYDMTNLHNDVWMATDKGAYCFKPNTSLHYRPIKYDKEAGMLHTRSTSIFVRDNKKYVGHRAGLSIIDGIAPKQIDLSAYTGEDVLEIEADKNGYIWCITADQLFQINLNGEIRKIDLPLSDTEELRALALNEDSSVNVLSDSQIFSVPTTEIEIFDIKNRNPDDCVQVYTVRNNFYYSDGHHVYGLERNNKWARHSAKKAPESVLHDDNGNPYLIFGNNTGLQLNKSSAKKLKQISIPEGEKLTNINTISGKDYYCTNRNLYVYEGGHFKLLSHKQDAFYKVVSTPNGAFAYAKNGIYKIGKESIVPLLASYRNIKFPSSTNQFELDGKLVTFSQSSLRIIDTNKESISESSLQPLEILDIKENGHLVWLLCKKSLVAIKKAELVLGKIAIEKVIPLYHPPLSSGQLYKYSDKEIWVQTPSKLYRIKVDDPIINYKPQIYCEKAYDSNGNALTLTPGKALQLKPKDLPVKFTFRSSNQWTDEIDYAYYLNFNGKNISEWKKENTYEFMPEANGKYTLTAKLKDDIYGFNVFHNDILMEVNGLTLNADQGGKGRLWIPLMLICGLLIWFVIKKI